MKEILITSSVLIVVLLLLRVIFAKKVSRVLIYGAWALVALRLLIPVQIGQLDFSILTAAKPVIEVVDERVEDAILGTAPEKSYEYHIQHYIEKDPSVFIPEVQEQIQQEISQGTQTREEIFEQIQQEFPEQEILTPEGQETVQMLVGMENATRLHNADTIVATIWLAGIAIMAIWFAVVNLRYSRMLLKNREKLECNSPIPVYVSERVGSPCLAGLLRPAIYLTPECAASEETMRHVLTHELTHYAHKDHIWSVVRCVCLCVYWFDPLVWVAAWFSRRDCELACDEGALKRLGEDQRIAYGKSLLDVVSHASRPANLMQTATSMNETKKQLKERVNFIVKKPKISLIAAICMVLACAIVAGCAAAGPATMGTPTTNPATSTPTQPTDPTEPKEPTKEVYVLTQIYKKIKDSTGGGFSVKQYDAQGNLTGGASSKFGKFYTEATAMIDRENRSYTEIYQEVAPEPYSSDKQTYKATYDTAGRILTYERYDNNDLLIYAETYTYNQDKLEKMIVARYDYEFNGDCRCDGMEHIYTYNAQGKVETEVKYRYYISTDGEELWGQEPVEVIEYSYDEEGKLIRKEWRTYYGTLKYYSTFVYDAEARTVTESRCWDDGDVMETITVYYSLDGRPVRKMSDDAFDIETTDYFYQKMQVPEDTLLITGVFDIPDNISPFWKNGGQEAGSMTFEADKELYEQAVTVLKNYATTGEIMFQDGRQEYEDVAALWAIYALFMRLGEYQQSPQYMQEVFDILQAL